MRGIETAFWGTLGRDPELKTSRAGKPFCGLALAVTVGKTDDGKDITQWVRATCFGEAAQKVGTTAKKGERIYCEGSLTLTAWTDKDGAARTGLNVAAWKCERLGNIGKAREKRESDDGGNNGAYRDHQTPIVGMSNHGSYGGRRELDDEIPF